MHGNDKDFGGHRQPINGGDVTISHAERALLSRELVCLAGHSDTNIDRPGNDYATITLDSIFSAPPTRFEKASSLAFIPSSYKSYDARTHAVQREKGLYCLLDAECDGGTTPDRLAELVEQFAQGTLWRVHTTANHRPGHDKVRGLIALQTPVPHDDWAVYQAAFFDYLERNGVVVDWSLLRAAQHVYMPNVPDFHVSDDGTRTPLRGADGEPLYYKSYSGGHGGIGEFIPHFKQCVDYVEALIAERQQEAEAKAAIRLASHIPASGDSPIARYNAATPTETLFDACGYIRSPRRGKDGSTHWHSPYQTTNSFATMLRPDGRWISLSDSDALAGIGIAVKVGTGINEGRVGDAFDLLVHYKYEKGEGRKHEDAFRAAFADICRIYGGNIISTLPAVAYEQTWTNPERLEPVEYVLDGFMEAGFSIISGVWGCGKTVNFVPIAACVAHIAPKQWNEDWNLWPTLRRKVLYITEDTSQAQRVMFSIMHHESETDPLLKPPPPLSEDRIKEAKEWFIIAEAKRGPVDWIAMRLGEAVARLCYPLDNGFIVQPLVVFDTQSANFDIENENDNSEVARVVATLRQTLPHTPIVLIGHTAKANVNRQDLAAGAMRGGGAWEADARATFVMMAERDDQGEVTGRYLVPVKSRLPRLAYTEISFGEHSRAFQQLTPWGELQVINYMHGVPIISNRVERRAAQHDANALNRDRESCQPYLDIIASDVAQGEVTSQRGFAERAGVGHHTTANKWLRRAVDRGFALHVDLPADIRPQGIAKVYVLPDTDVAAYFARVRERISNG